MQPGIQDAEFNLKAFVSTIPFLGFEGLVQLDYSVVPLIEARMNDSTNVTIDTLRNSLYNNVANSQQMIGLPAAIDDGTFSATYGGIIAPPIRSGNRPTFTATATSRRPAI